MAAKCPPPFLILKVLEEPDRARAREPEPAQVKEAEQAREAVEARAREPEPDQVKVREVVLEAEQAWEREEVRGLPATSRIKGQVMARGRVV